MTIDVWSITGQSQVDSYVGRWAGVAVDLVNHLAVRAAHGRRVVLPPAEPPWPEVSAADVEGLTRVAEELLPAFLGAATSLNTMLVRHAAVPALHGPAEGPWQLAFHQPGAPLVEEWAANAGTALAMVMGVGQGQRLGQCQAGSCDLVFFDTTRNASRRFCGLSCQNRAKAAAYRARRATPVPVIPREGR
ncbi:CGNR zinc finger domain-containing protein [Nonomuraea sp. NPDC050556]|uniref:CGNR zinc finger domain-containing protein n=1 Tax=Nonomuraea sp. NPDC050556 TaxID=3364369 RepID=UPI003791AE7D